MSECISLSCAHRRLPRVTANNWGQHTLRLRWCRVSVWLWEQITGNWMPSLSFAAKTRDVIQLRSCLNVWISKDRVFIITLNNVAQQWKLAENTAHFHIIPKKGNFVVVKLKCLRWYFLCWRNMLVFYIKMYMCWVVYIYHPKCFERCSNPPKSLIMLTVSWGRHRYKWTPQSGW